jgi:protein TonB
MLPRHTIKIFIFLVKPAKVGHGILKKLGLQRRIMETARTCILEKKEAMTSDEILKAAPLDLLFENRNKLYGAYPLRKYYHQRLTTAVGISLLVAAGLLFFICEYNKASGIQFMERGPDDEVVLRVQHIPEQPVVPEPPQAPQPQKPAPQVAQQRHTTIRITSDPVDVTDVPTQTDLKTTAIAATTTAGVPAVVDIPAIPSGTEAPKPPKKSTEVLVSAAPQFPGGTDAWAAFLSRHLQVPDELEAGVKKTVMVRFSVSETGAVTGFEVVQSGGALFDAEVIRVLKKMPKWKPAIKNGQPVAVPFTQPVTFVAVED